MSKKHDGLKFDEIGIWSEIKLEIVKKYAAAYSKIFTAQQKVKFKHTYIDAFSGAGVHVSKDTKELIPGSPANALKVQPPFHEFYFIDLNGDKVDHLQQLAEEILGDTRNTHFFCGDCNKVLIDDVFPHVDYKRYERGLCLLDPYGLHLDWSVIHAAGQSRAIDMFLNFPIMDMNRNALWLNPHGVDEGDKARMNVFWGDDSWQRIVYKNVRTLFGVEQEKVAKNGQVAAAFVDRLRNIAGFAHVTEPLPMKNSLGAVVYYLMFASQNESAVNIARDIFKNYR